MLILGFIELTCLSAGVASPNLVTMLVDDEEGYNAFVPADALVPAPTGGQSLVVESIEAAEDNLPQHLHRVPCMQVVGQHLAEVSAIPLLSRS